MNDVHVWHVEDEERKRKRERGGWGHCVLCKEQPHNQCRMRGREATQYDERRMALCVKT